MSDDQEQPPQSEMMPVDNKTVDSKPSTGDDLETIITHLHQVHMESMERIRHLLQNLGKTSTDSVVTKGASASFVGVIGYRATTR